MIDWGDIELHPGGARSNPPRVYHVPLAARQYVSTRSARRALTSHEKQTRRIGYALKANDPDAIETAGAEMAQLILPWACLIPIPSSTGSTASNRLLAQAIQAHVPHATVIDVLARCAPLAEPTHKRRLRGGHVWRPDEHQITVRGHVPDGPVYFVDNVAVSGGTIAAAIEAVGRGIGLVWARS